MTSPETRCSGLCAILLTVQVDSGRPAGLMRDDHLGIISTSGVITFRILSRRIVVLPRYVRRVGSIFQHTVTQRSHIAIREQHPSRPAACFWDFAGNGVPLVREVRKGKEHGWRRGGIAEPK